jgi:Zn finger protein HypA/HybF involved in hydrogenase expression
MKKIILLSIVSLMIFAVQSKMSALEKLKIEYTITETNRLCDQCGGRGTVMDKDITRVEFGEENTQAPKNCPKCNGKKFITEAGKGGIDYYTKNIGIISFSPEAKRQKLFATKKYRKRFLDKYFSVDYILVVTKKTKQADIDQLPKALRRLHYLNLELKSIKKAEIDRTKGETKFELIYEPPKETTAQTSASQRDNNEAEDEFDEDKDTDAIKDSKRAIEEDKQEEPTRLYLSFRSNIIKKKTETATKKQIIELKNKYHLLYD